MNVSIIGMQGSGANVIARLLNDMGVSNGLIPVDPDGDSSREDVKTLNTQLLDAGLAKWPSIIDFSLESIKSEYTDLEPSINSVAGELGSDLPTLIADARFCLLYPLWKEKLTDSLVIHVIRSPLNNAKWLLDNTEVPVTVGVALWEFYNLQSLAGTDSERRIVIYLDEFIKNLESNIAQLAGVLEEAGISGLDTNATIDSERLEALHNESYTVMEEAHFLNGSQMMLRDLLVSGEIAELDDYEMSPSGLEVLRMYELSQSREKRAKELEISILTAGLNAMNTGDIAMVDTLARTILSSQPSNPDALHLLGLANFQNGKVEEAISLLQLSIKVRPDSVMTVNDLGIIYRSIGQNDIAADYFKKAIAINPDYELAKQNLEELEQGAKEPDFKNHIMSF
jgi:tetratricopeptide (TPR) repeat protein